MKVLAAVAFPLLWSNLARLVLPVGQRGRTVANAFVATAYAALWHGDPRWRSGRGLRDGLAAAAVVTTAYAAALAVPATRAGLAEFADRDAGTGPLEWVTVHIPIGTVYSEELVFRATLDPLLATTLGPRLGPSVGAVVFGLCHIDAARAAGDSIPGTVFVTTLGGLLFGTLSRRAGSAMAPALLHLALNAGGVLAPRLARVVTVWVGRGGRADR